MIAGICDGHSVRRLQLQQAKDEVHTRIRAIWRLVAEQLVKGALLEQKPISILLCRVGAHEEWLCCEEVESTPTEAPGIHLRRQVVLLFMQLGRSERLTNQSMEGNHLFPATRINLKVNCLPRVTDLDLPMTVGWIHIEQHVFKRCVLHSNTFFVKKCKTQSGLTNQEACMLLVKACRFLLQGFEEVPTPTELEDAVVTVHVLKMLLHFHHVLVSAHDICKFNLAKRHLAKLNGVGLLHLLKLALVEHLDCKVAARGATLGLIDTAKKCTLQVHDKLVLLQLALNVWAYNLRLAAIALPLSLLLA
mmetsp:Transcript_81236/g.143271  ORF Transcript_81236/g.143271 Transcript_81236/m.143271 type:complete len:305 (+) Transcript_81236:1367-2281(+)